MNKILKVNKIIVLLFLVYFSCFLFGCNSEKDLIMDCGEPGYEEGTNLYVNSLDKNKLNDWEKTDNYPFNVYDGLRIKFEYYSQEVSTEHFYNLNNSQNKKYLENIGVEIYTSNMKIINQNVKDNSVKKLKKTEYTFDIEFDDEEDIGFFYIIERKEYMLNSIHQIYFKKIDGKIYAYYYNNTLSVNYLFRNNEILEYDLLKRCRTLKIKEIIKRENLESTKHNQFSTNEQYPELYEEIERDKTIYMEELSENIYHQFIENPFYDELIFINNYAVPINIEDELVLTTSKISDVLSLDVKGEGFEVVEQPYYADERVNLVVRFDKNTQYSYIKLIIKLNNGDEKILEVFGYHEDEMICYCFYNTKDLSYDNFDFDEMVNVFIEDYIMTYKSEKEITSYTIKYDEYDLIFRETFNKIREKY